MDGRVSELSTLLRLGLDVNATNMDGDTPLHLASRHGRLDIAQCLVEAFPDEILRNNRGMTPLDEATSAGEIGCVECILDFSQRGKVHTMENRCRAERNHLEKLRRDKVSNFESVLNSKMR